jgi:YbgC/YbaW family acyl-CoA thioester hydrolase
LKSRASRSHLKVIFGGSWRGVVAPFACVVGIFDDLDGEMDLDELALTTEEEVMFFDTDCGGVVHNIAYLRMIETCRTRLAGLMGLDLKTMARTELFPVVVRTEIDYKKPARLGDQLEIRGRVSEIGKVKFWCDFEVVRKEGSRPLIRCRQALALVQMPEGKPQRLPAEWF